MRLHLPLPHPPPKNYFCNPLLGTRFKREHSLQQDSRLSTRSNLSNYSRSQQPSSSLRPPKPRPSTSQAAGSLGKPTHKPEPPFLPPASTDSSSSDPFLPIRVQFVDRVEDSSSSDPFLPIRVQFVDKVESAFEAGQVPQIQTSTKHVLQGVVKTDLLGPFSRSFIAAIDPYRLECLSAEPATTLLPDLEYISQKKQLVSTIESFARQNQTLPLISILHSYCFYPTHVRAQRLRAFIQSLSLEFYQRKSVCKDTPYYIFLSDGKKVNDFLDIPFHTQSFFLASSSQHFCKYSKFLQASLKSTKISFIEEIKQSFKKNNQISCFHNTQKDTVKSQREKQLQSKEKLKMFHTILTKRKEKFVTKNQQRQISSFSKVQQQKKIERFSCSTNAQIIEKCQFATSLCSLRDFLYYSDKGPSKSHQRLLKAEFQTYYRLNDRYNLTYNYQNGLNRKILFRNLKENYPYFNEKTDEQLSCIKKGLLNYLGEHSLEEVSQRNFEKMHAVIIGVHSLDQILQFICKYLNFDEYGELKRTHFKNMIQKIIKRDRRNADIIEKIIWDSFEKHQLADSQCLKRYKLEHSPSKNKLVFYLLLSVIFGDCMCQHLLNIKNN